ncbi:MAG: alanine--tRNA ligase [Hyphomonadaceae bacterium]|nr:alanine--tRNA ligase [Hyphomonadaceae bacterium]
MQSVNDIRRQFLDFFRSRGHETPPSSPLVPQDDPTLLFTNAGMVQFKHYFTGAAKPPYPRAATSQKCVRAGGKHNDLDNVGYTARHLTFFEMLGNFSFGDYFKEGAIDAAWSLITKDLGLPKDKLLVTVYHDDDEAAALWKKIAGFSDDKIIRIATSDNFWSMGDTGPCGPCSEIFIDRGDKIWGGPPGSAEQDGDRYLEFWNLVFMQFEQFGEGRPREKLPKPSIDTGMGLERIACVLQGVDSVFETDLFKTLIAASEDLTKTKAQGEQAPSHNVIADHLRSSCFLIADGVTPSNEGRGYVLRRIMRRAMRHAHILGAKEPLMHRLAPTLVSEMGDAFPELKRALPVITAQLRDEEDRFQRTLGNGLRLLEDELSTLKQGDKLAGETAFKLYDTFGFPLDLTQDILRGRGLEVDAAAFDAAMERQREKGRESWAGSGETAGEELWLSLAAQGGPTNFLGYSEERAPATLLAIVANGAVTHELTQASEAALVFDKTPFYGESGGQAGDQGVIHFESGAEFIVDDTQKQAGLHVHIGRLKGGAIKPGDKAELEIDHARRAAIRANHSATHLLHAALRNTLGPHVTQKGSLVEADRFRFDFSHGQALTPAEIDKIEDEVNAVIRQNAEGVIKETTPEQAIAEGALALFGEKYGDTVRVLRLGDALDAEGKPYSVELCGGTHVKRTGDIALFTIISDGGVAAGIRRIEATTGAAALAHLKAQAALAKAISSNLKTPLPELPERISQLQDERKKLERELGEAKKRLALAGDGAAAAPAGPETVAGVSVLARVLNGVPAKDLRGLVDEGKKSLGSGIVAYVGVDDGKAALAIGVTDDLKGKVSAVDLVKAGVAAVGGQGGGGRPDMAQGGGPNGAAAPQALEAIRAALKGALAA